MKDSKSKHDVYPFVPESIKKHHNFVKKTTPDPSYYFLSSRKFISYPTIKL